MLTKQCMIDKSLSILSKTAHFEEVKECFVVVSSSSFHIGKFSPEISRLHWAVFACIQWVIDWLILWAFYCATRNKKIMNEPTSLKKIKLPHIFSQMLPRVNQFVLLLVSRPAKNNSISNENHLFSRLTSNSEEDFSSLNVSSITSNCFCPLEVK